MVGFAPPGYAPGNELVGRGDRRSAIAIPRPTAKFALTGHRSFVMCVVFIPTRAFLAQQARKLQLKFVTLKRVTCDSL